MADDEVVKDKSTIEFTDGQKSQIQIMIWKSVATIGFGIIAFLGAILIWYTNYQISSSKTEITTLKKKGEEAIESIKNNAKKTQRIVSLISDFGSGAYYVSNFKGRILSEHPNANLIDISHEIRSFDITEGSWVLSQAAKTLPEESIVWGIVNPGADLRNSIFIITQKPRHYLVGAHQSLFDNIVANEKILAAYKPNFASDDDKFGTKTFADLINALLSGDSIQQLIDKKLIQKDPVQYEPQLESCTMPKWSETTVSGCVCSVDRWGNILTNIPRKSFFSIVENHKYSITINSKTLKDLTYGISYSDGRDKPGIVIDQDGYIQIAIYTKSASDYFGITKSGQKIVIEKK